MSDSPYPPRDVSPYLLKPLRTLDEALADIQLHRLKGALRRWRTVVDAAAGGAADADGT